jgi:uncharacterized damage-inducible protein DinB
VNSKEILLAQLDACHENTWFVSLLNAIDGVSKEQASWKPNETSNSIFEIVNHLIFYNERYLNWFKGMKNESTAETNTFENKGALSWSETVKRITHIMNEWKRVVEQSDLTESDNKALELAHLTIHTTYHTGQIIYIRKLHDSWDPKNGVKG